MRRKLAGRSLLAILATLAVAVALPACGSSDDSGSGDKEDLTVFAASSLTEAFTNLGKQYEAAHEGAVVRFNFGSSSDLAAQIDQGAPAEVFLTGALTLLLTTAGLVFFVVDAERHLGGQPAWVQRIMHGWIWLGQRAVWLAAGAIFARLIASRLSLFIAELHYLSSTFQAAGVGESLAAWWRSMTGS